MYSLSRTEGWYDSTSCRWLNPFKAHPSQIERIDEHIDHANRVALVNEIIEAFGQ
jgi:hypothetical protein